MSYVRVIGGSDTRVDLQIHPLPDEGSSEYSNNRLKLNNLRKPDNRNKRVTCKRRKSMNGTLGETSCQVLYC